MTMRSTVHITYCKRTSLTEVIGPGHKEKVRLWLYNGGKKKKYVFHIGDPAEHLLVLSCAILIVKNTCHSYSLRIA